MVRKPKITEKEVYEELAKRVNAPKELMQKVFRAYQKMIYQCAVEQVEIAFGSMGCFKTFIKPPREHIEWNSWGVNGEKIVFYLDQADGYVKPYFRFYPNVWKEAKEILAIPYGSMPALPGCKEFHPVSDKYVDYREYKKNKNNKEDLDELEEMELEENE